MVRKMIYGKADIELIRPETNPLGGTIYHDPINFNEMRSFVCVNRCSKGHRS